MTAHSLTIASPQCEHCQMRHLTMFCDLSHDDLGVMSSLKVHRSYQRGQMIYGEGESPQGIYCLFDGTVKIFKNAREGKEQIVRLIRPGGVFGYRALLGGQQHANCAAALEPVRLCYIPRTLFLSMASENPAFAFKILEVLSVDLRRAEGHLVDAMQKSVRERLAETLLLFRETFGIERDGVTLSMHLTRIEVAEMVGAATESVIRLLMQFKQEGIIGLRGRRISILRPDLLLREANVEE